MTARGLPPAIARELRRMTPRARRDAACELEPDAAKFARAFKWGRPNERAEVVRTCLPAAQLEELGSLEAIEYRATKGRSGRATYVHDFSSPFPIVARELRASSRFRCSSRGSRVPRPGARGVTELGPLVALEGTTPDGKPYRLEPPAGVLVACDPISKGLVIVCRGGTKFPAHYIGRRRSKYTITDRGIVG